MSSNFGAKKKNIFQEQSFVQIEFSQFLDKNLTFGIVCFNLSYINWTEKSSSMASSSQLSSQTLTSSSSVFPFHPKKNVEKSGSSTSSRSSKILTFCWELFKFVIFFQFAEVYGLFLHFCRHFYTKLKKCFLF